MPFDIAGIAEGAAGGVIGTGMGLLLEGHNDRRQLAQEAKLQAQQMQGQKEMAEFNRMQQMKIWEDTNYGAQIKQLKKAGLNPGLIYGMSGGGGATTNAAQAAGPTSGSAPKGGGEAMGLMQGTMQAGMQLALMQAQKENIEADTKNKLGDASNKPLVGENLKADTALKEVRQMLDNVELEIKGESTKALKYIINAEADQALQRLNILKNEAIISENTWSQEIEMVTTRLAGMAIQNELTRSNITVNEAQISKWVQELKNATKGLDLHERETKVTEKLGDFNTSLSREALGALGGVISTIIGKGMTKAPINNTTIENQTLKFKKK